MGPINIPCRRFPIPYKTVSFHYSIHQFMFYRSSLNILFIIIDNATYLPYSEQLLKRPNHIFTVAFLEFTTFEIQPLPYLVYKIP